MIRTDFTDDAAWSQVCAAAGSGVHAQGPDGLFRAHLDCIDDAEFDGLTIEQLLTRPPGGADLDHVFLADRETITHPDHPILAVDLVAQPGRSFRMVPSEMQAVENDLSIANMDFAELADFVEADETGRTDGIFRGFPNY